MENWGATTSKEDSIFYNSNMSKLSERNALNMGHEFGHIWFGDLVTTSSFGEFWLNEGFARFMDIKASDIYKEHDGAISSYTTTLHAALWRDDELTARPLSREIKNPIEAYELLSNINYEKGGSVLKMVENLIGEELMQTVIQAYIKKYQYQNVVSQSFIDVLQTFVSFNATDFLQGFIKQNGYPLITVKNKSKASVSLHKERFVRLGQSHQKGSWSVPIKYITNLSPKPKLVWFYGSKNEITLKFPKKINWIKLNFQQSGYYRTNYPKKMWRQLIKDIKGFTIQGRLNLLDDSMAAVRSGHLECKIALEVTSYLRNEERIEAWELAQSNFGKIRLGLLQHNLTITYLKKYIVELIDQQYRKLNWTVDKDESYKTKSNRFVIFNMACFYGHQDCRKMVKNLWSDRSTLPIDIRNIVLRNNPNKEINYNRTSQDSMESLSTFFGADLSKLPMDPGFRWPKKIMQNCNKWLKVQTSH